MYKKNIIKKIIVLSSAVIIALSSLGSVKYSYSETNRFNMSYIYFGNSNIYSSYVNRTNNSLQEISPNYFNLDDDGNLKLTDVDIKFIEEMHNKNIKVVPFISNHWDRELGRLALKNKTKLIKDIAKAIKDYNLDGINVDIENLTGADRDEYTEFVKMLRKALPSQKIISVAVAPNPYEFETEWQKSYDYEKLARYSDYLVIMSYDESYPGGSAGPVASFSFAEKSIQYAIKRVPKEKIVLGIPFYGRYWKTGEAKGGEGISLNKVNELIMKYESQIYYDDEYDSPVATITIKPEEPKTIASWQELKPGTYTIWYENDKSIQKKLTLIEKYDIKGTASWSLGQELEETWNYYDLWLNGYNFIDTNNHWAERNIFLVKQKGWMKGMGKNIFSPETNLTRAQAAVTLVKALNITEESKEVYFNDVNSKHWAFNEISKAKMYGIIKGDDRGNFNPDHPITREEMASMLNSILINLPNNAINKTPFNDINTHSWAYNSILKMIENKIFTGYEDGTFRPKEKITRAQMATLMYKISKFIQ